MAARPLTSMPAPTLAVMAALVVDDVVAGAVLVEEVPELLVLPVLFVVLVPLPEAVLLASDWKAPKVLLPLPGAFRANTMPFWQWFFGLHSHQRQWHATLGESAVHTGSARRRTTREYPQSRWMARCS